MNYNECRVEMKRSLYSYSFHNFVSTLFQSISHKLDVVGDGVVHKPVDKLEI